MKTTIGVIVGLALMALAGVAQGQIQQVRIENNPIAGRYIPVPEGKKWIKFHYLKSSQTATIRKNYVVNVSGTDIIRVDVGDPPIRDLVLPIVDDAGPLWFGAGIVATFEFVDPPNTEALKKPSTAVVIPADGGGDVEVIMESSTDMVTWTEALPGTYGTDTAKRFFRLRAVRVP